MKSRRYLITLFKYAMNQEEGELIDTLHIMTIDMLMSRYEVAYIEHNKENIDNPHYHIYVRSKNAIRFETLKNLNKYMHIEIARGNDTQIKKYFLHEDSKSVIEGKNKYEENEIKGNLIFNDIEDLREKLLNDIASGMSTYEVILSNPQYLFKVKEIKMIVEERKLYENTNNFNNYINSDSNTKKEKEK